MGDDRVGETHPQLIIQEALCIQFSQRAKARLLIEFDRRKGLKRSGDALDEGHRGPPCSCVLTRWAGLPSQERATVAQTSMKVCLSSCLKSIAGSKRFFQVQTSQPALLLGKLMPREIAICSGRSSQAFLPGFAPAQRERRQSFLLPAPALALLEWSPEGDRCAETRGSSRGPELLP